jgi:hypothetical protein
MKEGSCLRLDCDGESPFSLVGVQLVVTSPSSAASRDGYCAEVGQLVP